MEMSLITRSEKYVEFVYGIDLKQFQRYRNPSTGGKEFNMLLNQPMSEH